MKSDLSGPMLEDARESLAYWERRARRLPRHAVRRRREARAMAVRWRTRVADADRSAYGRGLLGALLLVAAEHRLPESTSHAWRAIARHAARAALVLTATLLALMVAGAVLLFAALLHAPA